MGTSADYAGGTGGDWTPYKHAVNNFAKNGAGPDGVRVQRILSRYLVAMGGAGPAATSSRTQQAVSAGQGIAGFAAGVARSGLEATLQSLGFSSLIGSNRYELLDGLIEALGGKGGTLEEQSVMSAVVATLDKLFPDDVESFDELETVELDAEDLKEIVETFVGEWAYYDMAPTFAEKLTHIEDPQEALHRDTELRQLISDLVRIEVGDTDLLSVDWAGDAGHEIVLGVVDNLFEIIEGDLES